MGCFYFWAVPKYMAVPKVKAFIHLGCVWILYFENAFPLKCILENAFSRMHFAENSAFGKIPKLSLRSDYAE
jgi:hypothetical protein